MRTAWLAIVAAAAILAAAPTASAHATLQSSEPAAGARLAEAPTQVRVAFTEPVDPAGTQVAVVDVAGARVDDCRQTLSDDRFTATVGLVPGLPDGAYSIEWRTLSSTDGHTIQGSVGFAIGAGDPGATRGNNADSVSLPAVAGRAFVFAGIALAAGALVYRGILEPGPANATARRALVLGATLHFVGVGIILAANFQATAGASSCAGPLSFGDQAQAFLAGDVARILALRVVIAAGAAWIALIALRHPTRLGPWAVAALLGFAGLLSARLGHGSIGGPAVVAIDFLHLVATTTWAGGLVLFFLHLRATRADPDALLRVGRRFGSLAVVALAIVVATGTILAIDILGGPRVAEALGSLWGVALLLKVAAVGLMAVLGGVNRFVVLEPAARHGWKQALQRIAARLSGGHLRPISAERGPREMRRLVALEAGFGVVVILLAALLTSVSPPSMAAPSGPLTAQGDAFDVLLTVEPTARAGESSNLELTLTAFDGTPLDGATDCGRSSSCVRLNVTTNGRSPQFIDATWHDDHWSVEGFVWTASGPARIVVLASSAAVYEDSITFDIVVA